MFIQGRARAPHSPSGFTTRSDGESGVYHSYIGGGAYRPLTSCIGEVTMAGESAAESARRQREKAERLARSAELWERGAEGERRTADALTGLPPDSWTVFHDLRWPGRRFANVDHVVVGPPGVFVIDSKNWTGAITVTSNVLRQNGRAREEAVVGAVESALAIGQLVPLLRPDLVKPVLCFAREEPLTGWARDVMITSMTTLVPMLLSRPMVLSPDEIRHLSLDLDGGIRSAMADLPTSAARGRRTARNHWADSRPAAKRTVRRRPKKDTGLLRSTLVLIALIVFLSSASLREGVVGWVSDLVIGEVAEPAPFDGNQKKPADKPCKQPADQATSDCNPARK